MHVFTKVGSDMGQGHHDLSAKWIVAAVEGSLKRLQTDYIDLYQSHWPDPNTPQEETLRAHDELVRAGKVRFIGASNHDAGLLGEALAISAREGLARYETIQNEFNLHTRDRFEGPVQDLCLREQVSGMHYYALAAGFLTGKYRSAADAGKSPRGAGVVKKYLDERGLRLLATLDGVAARTGAARGEIALAWIAAQPAVAAPIASATTLEQLHGLIRGARLTLGPDDLAQLTEAGR
jgi:aryl-alcohol dehydrogenase-like predicted oxidoreductase